MLGGPRWAINLQIDLSATGLNVSGPTRLFVGATVHTSTGDVIVGNTTPKVGTDVDRLDATPIPKRSNLWAQYDALGTACTGITVDSSDIGVWTGTPGVNGGGSLTNQICSGSGCAATENTFRVTVRNVPNNAGIGPWDLRVRLRLANWGTQTAYQEDAPWPDIATTPTGSQIILEPLTTDFTTVNGWYWALPVDAGDGTSTVTVDYKCTKGGAAFCPPIADPSALHQAVSVELSVPSGFWPIATASAYRNVEFTSSTSGPGSGGASGASSGGASGASSGGASGASSGGASAGGTGGVPVGEAGASLGGDAGTGEAGETSGGRSNVSGAPSTSAAGASTGTSTAQGGTAQGGTAQGAAGTATAPTAPDKGSSCGCRAVGRGSSGSANLAALLVLGVALRRRNRKRAGLLAE